MLHIFLYNIIEKCGIIKKYMFICLIDYVN